MSYSLPQSLGATIRFLRKKHGLTQSQLAEATGMTQGFVSQLEKDTKRPTLEVLETFARVLQVPSYMLVYLFSRERQKELAEKQEHTTFFKNMFENLDLLSEAILILSGSPPKQEGNLSHEERLLQELEQKRQEMADLKEQLLRVKSAKKTSISSQHPQHEPIG